MKQKTTTVHQLRPAPLPKRRVLVVDDGLDAVHSMALLVKNVRIIAISGCSDDETQRRVLEAGAAEFLRKPISPAELERLLGNP